jgi:hypothetical protein
MAAEERTALAASVDVRVHRVGAQPAETLYFAEFRLASAFAALGMAEGAIEPQVRTALELRFRNPTTNVLTETPVCRRVAAVSLDADRAMDVGGLPRLVSVAADTPLVVYHEYDAPFGLRRVDATTWAIEIAIAPRDPLVRADNVYRVVVHSQLVAAGGAGAIADRGYESSFLVFNMLLMLLPGLYVREESLAKLDRLWIRRLDLPQRIYRMCLAIRLCRDAGDTEREEQLVREFFDLVRSREQVVRVTAK